MAKTPNAHNPISPYPSNVSVTVSDRYDGCTALHCTALHW